MPEIVSVRFKPSGPMYHFDPAGVEFETGDWVIVDTARGKSMGKVISAPQQRSEETSSEGLKSVLSKATPEELEKAEKFKAMEPETLAQCAQVIARHGLEMKAVAAEYNFDGSHLTIFFSAENKVDFRGLLKELGSIFKTRVELRQIGARDVAKLLGGTGRCGRALCCTTHLSKFEPISVRMARDQDLPLNPAMISGLCGKLLCCLKYEHSQYVSMKASMPGIGAIVSTPNGKGKVIKMSSLKESVMVRLENDTTQQFEVSRIKLISKPPKKGKG